MCGKVSASAQKVGKSDQPAFSCCLILLGSVRGGACVSVNSYNRHMGWGGRWFYIAKSVLHAILHLRPTIVLFGATTPGEVGVVDHRVVKTTLGASLRIVCHGAYHHVIFAATANFDVAFRYRYNLILSLTIP